MQRGDKLYKVEIYVDTCGSIDYSVISGICLYWPNYEYGDIVVNLDGDLDGENESVRESSELWYDSKFFALAEFRNKLEALLESVKAELNAMSESGTTKVKKIKEK